MSRINLDRTINNPDTNQTLLIIKEPEQVRVEWNHVPLMDLLVMLMTTKEY